MSAAPGGSDIAGLADIALGERALIVCDVDEVVLEFLTPFDAFLNARGLRLVPRSFRLTGNVVTAAEERAVAAEEVARLQEAFFADQESWQTPVETAAAALERLSRRADIVFLTAMPPRHFDARRRLLDRHGMRYPMVASEDAKGPLVRRLHRERTHPVVFLDDIVTNLASVRTHMPSSLLVNLMANAAFRALAPHPGDGVLIAEDWRHAEALIDGHLSGPR